MRALVAMFCTALFVFAVATVWSDLLQPQGTAALLRSGSRTSATRLEKPAQKQTSPMVSRSAGDGSPAAAKPSAGAAVTGNERPIQSVLLASRDAKPNPPSVQTDEVRQHAEEVRQSEVRLTTRQEALQLVYDDIRAELFSVDELRRRTASELAISEQQVIAAVRFETVPLNVAAQRMPETKSAIGNVRTSVTPSIDSSSVRGAAWLIKSLCSQGNTETAISELKLLKDRDASKVLAALSTQDAALARELASALHNAKR